MLLDFQLENKKEDRDQVVILFQDMLEVFTRDIMMEDNISRWACYNNNNYYYYINSPEWYGLNWITHSSI